MTSNSSGWVAVVANGAAATLSLGSTTALERVELMAVNNYKPASFVVEVQQSSGGTWQQVASGTGDDFVAWADNSSARAVKSFPTAMASAIRVRFTGAVNSGLVWLTEWQVWSAGGSAVTQGFDAWGQVLQASGSIPTYGYTGREPDASGLMFYRARYYHPGLGQFISRDPLGLAAGINPYAYADGNPVMFTDPEGLLPAKPGTSPFSSYFGNPLVQETLSTIGNGARVAVGNLWSDTVNGTASWLERLTHSEEGALGRINAPVDVRNPIAQQVANDLRGVAGAGLALTPIKFGAGTIAANGGAFSRLVPGGGLAAHEAAGGHLLARHVGQTEASLAARLASQPRLGAASTFASRAEAEAAISGALSTNAASLNAWVNAGASGRLVINGAFSGGSVLQRGATAAVPGTGVRAVLEGTGGGNWRIITGYPTP